jgi:NAD(P)-dependent dehydrogenase (short-subunit alcohol dehydrogenase family)
LILSKEKTVRLKSKVAIITGSTSGVGASTAKIFAQEGAKVIVTGRSVERGEKVVAEIRAAGGDATFFQADMINEAEVKALVDFTLATYGRIDVLMNNHAPIAESIDKRMDMSIHVTPTADWDYLIKVGITSIYYMLKYTLPEMMKNGGGSIINISSLASLRGTQDSMSAYTASKGALNALTRQLANDYGRYDIRANTIVLGIIICNERMEAAFNHPVLKKEAIKSLCVNRLGAGDDIGHAAAFLASDQATYITGIELLVDGGSAARGPMPSLDDGWQTAAEAAK